MSKKPEKKGLAKRYNSSKVEFHDLPLLALADIGRVGKYGATKYGTYNWLKGGPASQYFNCALRHLLKWWYGKKGAGNDLESNSHHLAHAAWNMMAIVHLEKPQNLIDDRPDIELSDEELEELFKMLT